MKDKRSLGVFTIVKTLLITYVRRISNLTRLAGLEAKLAIRTMIQMAVVLIILAFLCVTTWLSLLFLLFTYLVSLHFSMVFSASMVVLINLLALIIAAVVVQKMKKNLFFPATRRQFLGFNIARRE